MADTLKELIVLDEILNNLFDTTYYSELDAQDAPARQLLTSPIPGTGRRIHFPFLLPNAQLEWLKEGNPHVYRQMEGHDVEIEFQKLAGGHEVRLLDLGTPFFNDLIMRQIEGLAVQLRHKPVQRISTILEDGDSDTYYTMWDGELLFSNSHSINGVTWDNLLGGALSSTTFRTAMTTLDTVPLGPDGEPLYMGASKYYLVVPPALKFTAMELMNSSWNVDTGTARGSYENILKGAAEVIVLPDLTDTNDWYLIAEYPSTKPFVHIQNPEHPATLISEIDWNSPNVLNNDRYQWSVKTFQEVYPTQFFQMVKVVN